MEPSAGMAKGRKMAAEFSASMAAEGLSVTFPAPAERVIRNVRKFPSERLSTTNTRLATNL